MSGPSREPKVGWEQQWRNQSRDLARRSELNARVSEEARWDFEEVKSSYRTVKKEKSLPSRNASCRTLDNASPCLP